ncbi:hypothetical protein ACFFRR_006468 [Megaselia abdita]
MNGRSILVFVVLALAVTICYGKGGGGPGKPFSPCEISRFKYENSHSVQIASLAPEHQEAGSEISENFVKEMDNCEISAVCFGPYIGFRNRCYAMAYAGASNQISALISTTVAP